MTIFNIRIVRLLVLVLGIALMTLVAPVSAGLLVSSDVFNVVGEYHPTTGAYLGPLTPSVNGVGQLGVKLNAAGDRMLVGHFNGGVDEFDANTGAFIKTYNPGSSVGTQWAGLYAPTGGVYLSSWATNDVREYDAVTGAFIRVVTAITSPSDMRIGPNGNLYIGSYGGGFVMEVDATSGALINQWSQPGGGQSRTNDIDFLPSGEILVTAMGTNKVFRYDTSYNLLGFFAGTGWGNTHGIEVSPIDGNIYVVDGISSQVHAFDPVTFTEIDSAFLNPGPGGKIVDLAFRVPEPATLGLLLSGMMLIRRRSSRKA
ncbi:MAG: PEP-CTERM sorting domain-containing protein [Planctomycetota bacterium]